MQTAFFWIVWGIASSWLLSHFYFTYNKEALERFRYLTVGINLSIFGLLFLPWLSFRASGLTGWQLIVQGNIFLGWLAFFLIVSTLFLLSNAARFMKLAVVLQIISSVWIFVAMKKLVPGTVTLDFKDTAPIFATLLLLTSNVTGLMMWQQIDLKK